jgi:hypothetical protein
MNTPPQLEERLAAELESVNTPQSETLCSVLRGLFHCLRDLDSRISLLENPQGTGVSTEARSR